MQITLVIPTIRENSILRFLNEWNKIFEKEMVNLIVIEDNPQKTFNIKKDSYKQEETLEEVKKNLNGNQLDFLFIDGDHSYEGVKKDFEMYSPLVRKVGIIAFHDIVKNYFDPKCQVDLFWKDLKLNSNLKEIMKQPFEGWAGIEILFLK